MTTAEHASRDEISSLPMALAVQTAASPPTALRTIVPELQILAPVAPLLEAHAAAWRRVIDVSPPYALILESDAKVSTDLHASIERLITEVESHDPEWRVIHLIAIDGPALSGAPDDALLRPAALDAPSAPGYLINVAGAGRALKRRKYHQRKHGTGTGAAFASVSTDGGGGTLGSYCCATMVVEPAPAAVADMPQSQKEMVMGLVAKGVMQVPGVL